jgi:cell division septation protein DedD
MRAMLGRLGVRGGVAAGLALVIVAVIVIAKLVGGQAAPIQRSVDPTAAVSVDSTSGDDAEVVTTPSSYPDDPVVRATAKSFAAAWLRRSLSPAAWHDGVASLATASLSQSLDGVDPQGVPATRMVGDPTLVFRTDRYAQVTIPVDTGTLTLNLLKLDDRWLVDAVDWGRV